MVMGFDLRPTFLAAGAVFGTVATIAAAYADLPALAVIGGVAVVANVIGAGVTHISGNPAELKLGDRMSDGTIFAGISPDTGKPMYTTPAGAPLTYSFNEARKYADRLDAHGHQDWRMPTKGELNVLWENRNEGALKGTFNVTGSGPAGWYGSSREDGGSAWGQRFSDGAQGWDFEDDGSSLRLVR
jgi:hypothetical protein